MPEYFTSQDAQPVLEEITQNYWVGKTNSPTIIALRQEEFARLYQKLKERLTRSMRKFSTPDVEDWVQEGLIKAFQKIGCYDSTQGRLYSWVCTLVERHCLDQVNKTNKEEIGYTELTHQYPGQNRLPDEELASKEHMQKIYGLVEKLPLEFRNVLELKAKGLKHRQIAQRLNIPLGTSLSRHSRAKEKFLELILDDPDLKEHYLIQKAQNKYRKN